MGLWFLTVEEENDTRLLQLLISNSFSDWLRTTNKPRLFCAAFPTSSSRRRCHLLLCFLLLSFHVLLVLLHLFFTPHYSLFSVLLFLSFFSFSCFLFFSISLFYYLSYLSFSLFLPYLSSCLLLSVLNSPCSLQDEEVLEELPEEEVEDVTPERNSTNSQEEVRSEISAAQVGQQQISLLSCSRSDVRLNYIAYIKKWLS